MEAIVGALLQPPEGKHCSSKPAEPVQSLFEPSLLLWKMMYTNLLAWKSWSTTSRSTSPLSTLAVFWKISVEQAFNLPRRLTNRSTSYNGGPPAIRWSATRRSAFVVAHPLLTKAQDQLRHLFGNVQYDLWIWSLHLSLLFDAISFLSKSLFMLTEGFWKDGTDYYP